MTKISGQSADGLPNKCSKLHVKMSKESGVKLTIVSQVKLYVPYYFRMNELIWVFSAYTNPCFNLLNNS